MITFEEKDDDFVIIDVPALSKGAGKRFHDAVKRRW